MTQILAHTVVTVTTAGTRVQVSATATPVVSVTFEGYRTNAGNIYVGSSTVAATNYAAKLAAGDSVAISGDQIRGTNDELLLSDLYVDAATSGEKVAVSYLTRR